MKVSILLASFIIIYGGINFYICVRLCRWLRTVTQRPAFSKAAAVIYSVLALTLVLGLFPMPAEWIGKLIEGINSRWMGIFVYLFLATVLADIVLLALKPAGIASEPLSEGMVILSGTAVVLVTAAVCIAGFAHAKRLKTVSYEVKDVSETPLRAVLISDIHLGAIGTEDKLPGIIDAVNAEEPDIVFFAGDIYNGDFDAIKDPDKVSEEFMRLKPKYGCYACLGNHDAGDTLADMVGLAERSGIRVLREEWFIIPDVCIVAGRADSSPIGSSSMLRGDTADLITRICEAAEKEGDTEVSSVFGPSLPLIVLDHNPSHIGEYGTDVDLVLCGHTHAGQIWPGGLITGLMYDNDYGMSRKSWKDPQVIVTSGAGYWGPPMRVGTSCEIAVIDIN